MQPCGGVGGGGGGGVGGGGAELSRGLARFKSAPSTWLEALLESEEEENDPLKPTTQCLTQLPPTTSSAPPSAAASYVSSADPGLFDSRGGGASSGLGFLRQNSSPAEFLTQMSSSDSYLSNFGIPVNYDFLSSSIDVSPSSKRSREIDPQHPSSKFSSQLKVEQSGQLHGGMSGLLDAEMEKLLEDSVPCRVRAKRGCATHPRSIAERVRRTRISDRIRKLQELVPNMDKVLFFSWIREFLSSTRMIPSPRVFRCVKWYQSMDSSSSMTQDNGKHTIPIDVDRKVEVIWDAIEEHRLEVHELCNEICNLLADLGVIVNQRQPSVDSNCAGGFTRGQPASLRYFAEISYFNGSSKFKKEDFLDWLFDLENFFEFMKISHEKKVIFAFYKLDKIALKWWNGLQDYRVCKAN